MALSSLSHGFKREKSFDIAQSLKVPIIYVPYLYTVLIVTSVDILLLYSFVNPGIMVKLSS
jgi:hypothetical protein